MFSHDSFDISFLKSVPKYYFEHTFYLVLIYSFTSGKLDS